ncbi:MAG: hypothetical protein U0271_21760 [Polyangiaceae bacterium]
MDPTGRFQATVQLSETIYSHDFREHERRALERARRERGPVRILTANNELLATLEPPPESWTFGAQLEFSSTGEELFVAIPDQRRISIFAHSDGIWAQRSAVVTRRVPWLERASFVLLDDDHLWDSDHLFHRAEPHWRERARCPKPQAVSAGLDTIVCGQSPVEIRSGGAYAWPERTVVSLPRNAWATAIRLDPDARALYFTVEGAELALDRRPGVGWVQRSPFERQHAVQIEQPLPSPDDLMRAAETAVPWELGVAYPVGTFLSHKRFGVGVVMALDPQRGTMRVRFHEGEPRTFKV